MNVPKSSVTRTSLKLKKSGNFRTHMLNFNKQHFNEWDQGTVKGSKPASSHRASNSTLFMLILVITMLFYILTIFFYEKTSDILCYDVWFDISNLLDQSNYWQFQQASSKYTSFYTLDSIKNNTQTFPGLKETFSKIKILSFTTLE